ncbi:hypothetical protein J3A83DRAFT_4098347, partial [Scleroderma citrinum]
KNTRANMNRGDSTTFNISVATKSTLEDCFRIFTSHLQSSQPALHHNHWRNPHPALIVYTDSSCINNGRKNARSRVSAWYTNNHPLNKAIRVPCPNQLNQTGELAGILVALQTAPQMANLTIVTDS